MNRCRCTCQTNIAMNTCFWNLDAVSVLCTLVCKMSTSRLYVFTSYYFRCGHAIASQGLSHLIQYLTSCLALRSGIGCNIFFSNNVRHRRQIPHCKLKKQMCKLGLSQSFAYMLHSPPTFSVSLWLISLQHYTGVLYRKLCLVHEVYVVRNMQRHEHNVCIQILHLSSLLERLVTFALLGHVTMISPTSIK